MAFSSRSFYSSCMGGLTAGMLVSGLLTVCILRKPLEYLVPGGLFLTAAIALFTIPRWKHYSAAGKIFLLSVWLAVTGMLLWKNPAEGPQNTGYYAENIPLKPTLIVQSGLQPNRKNLKILFLGDSENILKQLTAFPLARKLVSLPLCGGTDIFRKLHSEANDYDLIMFQAPFPDNLYIERLYSIRFCRLLKDRLAPGGVMAFLFPEGGEQCREDQVQDFYGSAGAILQEVFSTVKPAEGDSRLLFCGGKNITNSPEELNIRAREYLGDSNYLPDGVFLMNPEEEHLEQERRFLSAIRREAAAKQSRLGNSLAWKSIRNHLCVRNKYSAQKLDFLRGILLKILIGLTVLMLAVRYFLSGGIERKRKFLTMENGLFNGLLMILFIIPYQQNTGRLSHDWILLTGIFSLSFFCGMLASFERHHFKLLKLLLILTLLLPLCGLAFRYGDYPVEPLILYACIAYAGYTGGAIFGDIRSEMPGMLLALSAGLLLGMVLYWLPGGTFFAVTAAVLCRIPPLAAENLQKQFDKRKKTYNI